jgi:hypothetical protein
MLEETANALYEYSPDEVDIRDDYSGRGMYHKKTYGVVFKNWSEGIAAIVDVAESIGCNPDRFENPEDILEDLRNISHDSMGLSIIVY